MTLPCLKSTSDTFSFGSHFYWFSGDLTVTINLITWSNWTIYRYALIYRNTMWGNVELQLTRACRESLALQKEAYPHFSQVFKNFSKKSKVISLPLSPQF